MKNRLRVFLFLLIFTPALKVSAEIVPNLLLKESSVKNALQQDEAGTGKKETKKSGSAYPLSDNQKQAIKMIMAETIKKAGPLALQLGISVKEIHEVMLAEKPDKVKFNRLNKKISGITAQLVIIRTQANQKIVDLLTSEQKQLIKDELVKRGGLIDISEALKGIFEISEK